MRRASTLVLVLLSGMPFEAAHARPEYAAREKLQCSSCHVTPWGGGPRTVMGKVYGARDLKVAGGPSLTMSQDSFYGDLRTIAYFPYQDTVAQRSGVALMEAAASANVALTQGQAEEAARETRVLATYNLSPLSGAQLREAFVRLSSGTHAFTIGRFYQPFGLLTDEHRTYTRIQSQSTINSYVTGIAFSTDLGSDTHADAAVVSDFSTNGGFTSGDLTYGGVVNLRWNPSQAPVLLGLSVNHERILNQPPPTAGSLYGVVSLDRWTDGALSGSLSLEGVVARNWNNPSLNTGSITSGLQSFFIPGASAAYFASLREDTSVGTYALAKVHLNPRVALFYKLDVLALDMDRVGNHFARHGIGVEHFMGPHLILNVRTEFATLPQEVSRGPGPAAPATLNNFLAMLQVWI